MDGAEADVLAYMGFPKAHRTQIHTTNPLERLNAEIKRRTDVVGIFPNSAAVIRLVGVLLLEQNDEWQLQRRYMQLEGLQTLSDNQTARLSAVELAQAFHIHRLQFAKPLAPRAQRHIADPVLLGDLRDPPTRN